MLGDVTILVKTFERYESLNYLLSSIAKMDFPCRVIIADDSRTPYKDKIQEKYGDLIDQYIVLPYDCGASKGRNVLVEHARTKYLLLCEDDFIFDHRTNLEYMLKQLDASDVDLLGGMCYNRVLLIDGPIKELIKNLLRLRVRTVGHMLLWRLYHNAILRNSLPVLRNEHVWDWYGYFKIKNQVCYMSRLSDSEYAAPYTRCDYVPNFFMAKKQSLVEKNVYWDEEIKFLGEHLDFFFRAKRRSLNVAITKAVGVIHQRIHPASFRVRRDDRHIMMQRNNLRDIQRVERI